MEEHESGPKAAGAAAFLVSFGIMVFHFTFHFLGNAWIIVESGVLAVAWGMVTVGEQHGKAQQKEIKKIQEFHEKTQFNATATFESLNELVKKSHLEINNKVTKDIEEMVLLLKESLPTIIKNNETNELTYNLRATAESYLPQTIEKFISIPTVLRKQPSVGGKSPEQHLESQIQILLESTKEVAYKLHTEKLAANGRFLEARLANVSKIVKTN